VNRNDDDIIAELDASGNFAIRIALVGVGLVALMALTFAAAYFSGHGALLQNEFAQAGVAVGVVVLFLIAFFGFSRRFVPPVESEDPRIVKRRIDVHHRKWRWFLVSNLPVTGFCVWNFVQALQGAANADRAYAALFAGLIVFQVVLFTAHTLAGPGGFSLKMHDLLNDEFIRDLRARTARVGYGTMMLTAGSALILGTWRPDLALLALAWALYAGFAIPALYYIVADWRAGRED
jgi:hypothetical protein